MATRSKVLAHRGFWRSPEERGTLAAFERALAAGWGLELDVRDAGGHAVLSHDVPRGDAVPLAALVDAYAASGSTGTLAVNIKADGLQRLVADSLAPISLESWFAFDMSVPDTLGYARAGLPWFTRHSDLEPAPVLDGAAGVWLDAFQSDWWDERVLADHLDAGRGVAVVSPELHGRAYEPVWERWCTWPAFSSPDVLLCTDHPSLAEEAFA